MDGFFECSKNVQRKRSIRKRGLTKVKRKNNKKWTHVLNTRKTKSRNGSSESRNWVADGNKFRQIINRDRLTYSYTNKNFPNTSEQPVHKHFIRNKAVVTWPKTVLILQRQTFEFKIGSNKQRRLNDVNFWYDVTHKCYRIVFKDIFDCNITFNLMALIILWNYVATHAGHSMFNSIFFDTQMIIDISSEFYFFALSSSPSRLHVR